MKERDQKLKSQIMKQKKLIKKLKNMIRIYAPYMEFPDEKQKKKHIGSM